MDFKVDIKRDYREDPREYFREYFMELKVFRWTQEEVTWVKNGQGWFQLTFNQFMPVVPTGTTIFSIFYNL